MALARRTHGDGMEITLCPLLWRIVGIVRNRWLDEACPYTGPALGARPSFEPHHGKARQDGASPSRGSALILAQQQALPRPPEEVVPPISLEDSYQAPPKSCGKDPAVLEAMCLAAAGAESPGLACSEGLLAGFAGGRWSAGRRVARERAIQRS